MVQSTKTALVTGAAIKRREKWLLKYCHKNLGTVKYQLTVFSLALPKHL
jgi:hypothetical protein